MRVRSTVAALGLLAAALAVAPPQALAEEGRGTFAAPADGQEHVVTLITGDRVRVDARGRYTFLPAEGREHVGYLRGVGDSAHPNGYLTPVDAAPLVSRGLLDRALFDVDGLIEDGYADGAALPVIVQGRDGDPADSGGFRSAAADSGLSIDGRELDSLGARAVDVTAGGAAELWSRIAPAGAARAMSADVGHIWLDGKAKLLLDESVPQIGAPVAWQAGYDGTGVTVAVLDTGYDPAHPDLAGRVAEAKDFSGVSPGAVDGHGHGTHVASTIAGSGAASDGKYKGVAPGAKLLVGKVLDDEGYGSFSQIVDGMEWAAAEGATAISMSLGNVPTDGTDPMSLAVNELSARYGTLFVVAAGNEGATQTVESPGAADAALTVGAVDKQDVPAYFSSQGPRMGDFAVKPDISAPGVDITAAEAGTGGYATHSGTSMATPHVSGAVAILKQEHPDWTGPQLKAALMGSAKGLGQVGVYTTGAGRVDVAAAIGQGVYAENPSVSYPVVSFQDDGTAKDRTVTYRNTSTVDVTLDLAVAAQTTDGLFSVVPSTLTVPAGGTAEAVVTLRAGAKDVIGTHGAVLTATAGDHTVRTPLGATVEPERYTVHVTASAPGGRAVADLNASLIPAVGHDYPRGTWNADGSVDFRVPPGDYYAVSAITDDHGAVTHAVLPVHVAGDTPLAFDGSKAVPVSVRMKDHDVPVTATYNLTGFLNPGTDGWGAVFGGGSEEAYTIPSGPLGAALFETDLTTTIVPTDPAATWQANLNEGHRGLPAIDAAYGDSQLARQESRYESQGVATSVLMSYGIEKGDNGFGTAYVKRPVPGSLTVYFSPGRWTSDAFLDNENDADPAFETKVHTADYTAGQTVALAWGRAPLGVALPTGSGVTRVNEEHFGSGLLIAVPMFTGPDPSLVTNTSYYLTGSQKVTLNGEVIADQNGRACSHGVPIPADASGTVTLSCSMDRKLPWSTIGSKSSAEWTFRTAAIPQGPETVDQNLNAVRLDATGVKDGYAKRGLPQLVSLSVDHTGAVATKITALTFEVSYDGGSTWRSVPVARYADTGVASLIHPAGATSVSVRMTTVDDHGNTSKQTTIDSWGLK